jgi:hypothetical protein
LVPVKVWAVLFREFKLKKVPASPEKLVALALPNIAPVADRLLVVILLAVISPNVGLFLNE